MGVDDTAGPLEWETSVGGEKVGLGGERGRVSE